jgi:DNA replication protein DnaC
MNETKQLEENLSYLRLAFIRENLQALTSDANQKQWTPIEYLTRLVAGEVDRRKDNKIKRRIKAARFPLIKTLDDFDWSWPRKINRQAVKDLFRFDFLNDHSNVILMGGVGLGKSHIGLALAYAACLRAHNVLFSSAVDIINTLTAAAAAHRLKNELKRYLTPRILCIDELGYLPIDKTGADLLFQVISHRYETASTIFTTNKPYKKWPEIFNNDSTMTSAILDRVLHHSITITIQGKSYRMKDNSDQT